jgi:hypothetical protein
MEIMLSKSALKTIAACMVYESKELSKPAKMQLVRFIENASPLQLQHYIVHDEIVRGKDAQIQEFLAPALLIAAAIAAGRAFYNNYFSKAAKECQEKENVAKKVCMKRYKLRGISGQISALQREMGKCNQTLRPDKCRKTFQQYIKDAENKRKKIEEE